MALLALPKQRRKRCPWDEFGVFYFRRGNSLEIDGLLKQ